MEDVSVWISGAADATSTASCTAPTVRLKSMRTVWFTCSRMLRKTASLKPAAVADTS